MDINFLLELDNQKIRETYARIVVLENDIIPVQVFEGKVTGGSINIDGKSAIRRTCSLSVLLTDEEDIINPDWYLNKRFKLEIGLHNMVNSFYPNIIWFEQGIYLFTSFSCSHTTSNITINLSGKDKMCLLNGEVNGALPATHDFGTVEEEATTETGEHIIYLNKVLISTIITEAVAEYGHESKHNIIIKDIDDYGLELWNYVGSEPIYYFRNVTDGDIYFMTTDSNTKVWYEDQQILISEVPQYYLMSSLTPSYNNKASVISLSNNTASYNIIKIDYNSTAGYHATPLVYNTDLILKAGETITSLLDKIVKMLGDYEYFYNLKGQFVFQKKNNYIQELYSTSTGAMEQPMMYNEFYSYKFMDTSKFTAMSISPNMNNIKNDFIVWGTTTKSNNISLNFHARWALQHKPTSYINLNGIEYDIDKYDWRELIYQMAVDKAENTGYEQYYTDMLGFWRQLYNPSPTEEDIQNYGEFYTTLESEEWKYWNKKIHSDPGSLFFWFDMLDTYGDLEKYSVDNIGQRSKVINENSVNTIYNIVAPEVLLTIAYQDPVKANKETEAAESIQSAHSPIQMREEDQYMFTRSAQGNSAIDKINELIINHTACSETLNLTSIPIFYLQPNTRIYVEGYGDYTIDKLTYNLSYNGTMTINATKILKHFI